MKTQHTPGPWQIEPEDHAIEIQCNAFVIGDVFYEEEEGQTIGPKTRSEAISNARLIASAPELLSALEKIAVGLSADSVSIQYENLPDLVASCFEIAHEALRKAKGEK